MLPQKKPQKLIGDGQNVATESAPSDQIAAGLMLRYNKRRGWLACDGLRLVGHINSIISLFWSKIVWETWPGLEKTCGKPGLFWKKLVGNQQGKPGPVSQETFAQGKLEGERPRGPPQGRIQGAGRGGGSVVSGTGRVGWEWSGRAPAASSLRTASERLFHIACSPFVVAPVSGTFTSHTRGRGECASMP